ncbi:MlaA family lipoprotein [Dongia sedimenti]|uniref:VacJ family lipoprotein n=1 Tax=Dongia sedimenti TaxID=3064282 RepID=A0ABU0YPJ1_9PROT|nr:VacJ family lipoprotein [Rhodospirillaceae bacterium R-7]
MAESAQTVSAAAPIQARHCARVAQIFSVRAAIRNAAAIRRSDTSSCDEDPCEPNASGVEMRHPRHLKHRSTLAFGLLAMATLGACAEVPTDPVARSAYDEANDPAEPTNRVIFDGNQWVDRNALQPVARAYQDNLPDGVRDSVHNFGQNLGAPLVLVNDVLQGNLDRAWTTTQRLAVNTTVGVAGLFDVASDWDLPAHKADFGQTMGVWGVESGPSVQLPLLGPSNLRDAAGTAFGLFGDPVGYVPGMQVVQTAGAVGGAIDGRARMLPLTDDLEKNSVDYYSAVRSLYAQHRAAFVAEGKAGGDPADADGTVMPSEP